MNQTRRQFIKFASALAGMSWLGLIPSINPETSVVDEAESQRIIDLFRATDSIITGALRSGIAPRQAINCFKAMQGISPESAEIIDCQSKQIISEITNQYPLREFSS